MRILLEDTYCPLSSSFPNIIMSDNDAYATSRKELSWRSGSKANSKIKYQKLNIFGRIFLCIYFVIFPTKISIVYLESVFEIWNFPIWVFVTA